MVRIASLATIAVGVVALVTVGNCSKSDPKTTDTAPPRASGDGTKGAAPVQIEVAKGPGGAESTGGGDSADTSFKLTTTQAAPTKAGGETTARLVVQPGSGYHMNKDFPTKLTLEPPAGVTLAKAVLEPADAEKFSETEEAEGRAGSQGRLITAR
jgi:hypothetical protein